MKSSLKNILTAASIALLPVAASAARFIVPAAGSASGANGSQWQSELIGRCLTDRRDHVVAEDPAANGFRRAAAWDAATDRSLLWSDPAMEIAWPIAEPILSTEDASAPPLRDADVFVVAG